MPGNKRRGGPGWCLGEPKGPLTLPQAMGQPLRDRTCHAWPQPLGDTGPVPWLSLPPSLDLCIPLGSGSLSAASCCEFSAMEGPLLLEFKPLGSSFQLYTGGFEQLL